MTTLHAVLTEPATLSRLTRLVSRRVAPQDVRDVVQAIVCDALAGRPPALPSDVPRWLAGIARHKIADHHRVTARRGSDGIDPAALPAPDAPIDARSLLRGMAADVGDGAQGRTTLRWIAREAEGEQLDEMAREASLQPATVRQRVSRLRRWLRKRWLREALLIGAASLALALLVAVRATPGRGARGAPIVADPGGDRAAAASAALQGRWQVVACTPDAALDPALRALVAADARGAVVEVQADRVVLTSTTKRAERRLEVGSVADGRVELRLVDANGTEQRAVATVDPSGRLVVAATDGAWRGTVVLAR
jgi:DNA-directed RNA polymerase specialized sigma24 family protein